VWLPYACAYKLELVIFIITLISKELNNLMHKDLHLRVRLVFDYSIWVKFNNEKDILNYQSITYVMVKIDMTIIKRNNKMTFYYF